MIFIVFFLILISIPFIFLAYQIFRATRKRNRKNIIVFSSIFLALILIPGYYFKLLPGSDFLWKPIDERKEKKYNHEITGLEFNLENPIYEYETERDFNGDGYSIWIFKLDDISANYFLYPDDDFFSKFPNVKIRNHWESEFWKSTPILENENSFFSFANHQVEGMKFSLKELINEEGNYYAYQYYIHNYSGDIRIGNIDFYIICPKRKLFIHINHNT